jgi:hypothetical protein
MSDELDNAVDDIGKAVSRALTGEYKDSMADGKGILQVRVAGSIKAHFHRLGLPVPTEIIFDEGRIEDGVYYLHVTVRVPPNTESVIIDISKSLTEDPWDGARAHSEGCGDNVDDDS